MIASPCAGVGWRHPHYQALADTRPALSFLEVHSENFFAEGGAALSVLLRARRDYPISLHGVGLGLGSVVGLDAWHLEQLARLVQRVQPVRVSDHASFARGQVPLGGQDITVHGSDLLPLPFSEAALDVLCRNVQQVQERLQQPLLVENLSAYLRWDPVATQCAFSEPQFLGELARRTGCRLLVDVNNIYVNALNDQIAAGAGLGVEARASALRQCHQWLDAIPPAVVGELHVAGHQQVQDEHGTIVIDDHGSRVSDEVWRLYRHALQRFGTATPSLVEWDTQLPTWDVLLAEAARARCMARDIALAAAGESHAE